MPKAPAKTWPEERLTCSCGHGECTACYTKQIVRWFNDARSKGNNLSCSMHKHFCGVCFECNLIDRLTRRANGEVLPPPN